jgi:hypothetical protein
MILKISIQNIGHLLQLVLLYPFSTLHYALFHAKWFWLYSWHYFVKCFILWYTLPLTYLTLDVKWSCEVHCSRP